jgi:hypothetical protein
MRSNSIETTTADGLHLRIEFQWLGDRFGHTISAVHPSGEIRPLLESIEGTPADNWPTSPPLQSLSIETLKDGRRAALLVGMAGGSHWSASIEATPCRAEFIFDMACRHNRQPIWLGSRYLWLIDSALTGLAVTGDCVRVTHAERVTAIEPCETTGQRSTTRWRFSIGIASTHALGTEY